MSLFLDLQITMVWLFKYFWIC